MICAASALNQHILRSMLGQQLEKWLRRPVSGVRGQIERSFLQLLLVLFVDSQDSEI